MSDQYRKMKGKAGTGVESIADESTSPLLSGPSSPSRKPPPDWCFTTYIIFYLLGVGHLLPWNFFITAKAYFEYKFDCNGGHNHSCSPILKLDFENYFSVAAMLPIAVMTAVNIWLQSRLHYKYRMMASLFIMLILFCLTLAFVKVGTSSWVNGFFSFTILIVVTINVFSAIFQSSTFGFAGVFPSHYTSVVMSGQAIAGILASVAQILSLVVSSNDPETSALIYFAIAVVFILICLMALLSMMKLRFVQHYLSHTSVEVKKTRQAILERSTNVRYDHSPPFFKIFMKIFVHAISVYFVFTVTLSLFPAVLAQITSSAPNRKSSGWTDTYFAPIVCFLMFNCSDFTGRYITQWVNVGKNRYVIFIASVLRFGFIPLTLLCNFGAPPDTSIAVFKNDVFPILFVLLIGFTNGYLGSVAMIGAPMSVLPEQRETASTIMVFFLAFGLLSGSALSFMWTKVVLKLS